MPREHGFGKRVSRHSRGYGSEWGKLRLEILRRDCSLCQPCLKRGVAKAANIVDHKVPKTDGGSDDPSNLQVICAPCHTWKTAGESARAKQGTVQFEPSWVPRASIQVTVVCGRPGSGKTTYVRERAGPSDLVLDLDAVAAEMFCLPLYHATTKSQTAVAVRFRNKMLASLADKNCGYTAAWLIVTARHSWQRDFWREKYGVLVFLETPLELCRERIENDTLRPEFAKRAALDALANWASRDDITTRPSQVRSSVACDESGLPTDPMHHWNRTNGAG